MPPSDTPFTIAFHTAISHGVVSAFHLPDSPDPVPERVLEELHPDEAAHARTLRGYTQVQFVGGRLALRAARRQVGAPLGPVLPDERGAPQLPEGFVGSVSHKKTLAVAVAARDHGATVGIDLEEREPARERIAERVLRPGELAAWREIPEEGRWLDLLLRFSTKESIYKALDPWVRRYVGFQEAEVTPTPDGVAEVALHLENGEGPFHVEARFLWLPERLLTSVRIRPLGAA